MKTDAHSQVRIILGGRDQGAYDRITRAVLRALDIYHCGKRPEPLMIVDPHADLAQVRAEVAEYSVRADTGLLMRTSGSSSGCGKIVELSWEGIIASAHASDSAMGGSGMWISALPVHHIAGFNTVIRSVLSGVRPLCLLANSEKNFSDMRMRLDQARSMGLHIYLAQVPTQLDRFLSDRASSQHSIGICGNSKPAGDLPLHHRLNKKLLQNSDIDAVLVGGDAVSIAILRKAQRMGIRVVKSYGSTETCGGCVYDGRPIGDTRIFLSSDSRICVAGSVLALGYLGHDENGDDAAFVDRTSEYIDSHYSSSEYLASCTLSHSQRACEPTEAGRCCVRMHLTRDIGMWDSDGRLVVCGRLDNSIITGGLTVMPGEIEQLMASLWHTDVIVVGVPDPVWGQAVVAISADALCEDEVRNAMKARCERGWVPRHVLPLRCLGGNWPLGGSGKIDRRALAARAQRYLADCASAGPTNMPTPQ